MVNRQDVWAYFSNPPEDQRQYVDRTIYRVMQGVHNNDVYLKGDDFYSGLERMFKSNTDNLPESVQERLAYNERRTIHHLMYLTLSGWVEDSVTGFVLCDSPKLFMTAKAIMDGETIMSPRPTIAHLFKRVKSFIKRLLLLSDNSHI